MSIVTRRRFLLTGLGLVVVAGVGVFGGSRAARSYIADAVRKKLSYLKLDEAGLQAFAKDQVDIYLAKRPSWNRLKYHYMSTFKKGEYSRYNTSNDTRTRSERQADNFAQTYLLSSDFFNNDADESRVVQYIAYCDPVRGCGNPFFRPAVQVKS